MAVAQVNTFILYNFTASENNFFLFLCLFKPSRQNIYFQLAQYTSVIAHMKQGSVSTKNSGSSAYSVMPPSNFSYFEESICRCSLPLNRQSIPFLQSTSVNFVVNITGRKLEAAIVSFFEDRNIEIVSDICFPHRFKITVRSFCPPTENSSPRRGKPTHKSHCGI